MPVTPAFTERRHAVRSRTFIGGKAIFNQRQSTLDCLVRNLSEGGALLIFPSSVAVPERFELHFPLKRESRMVRSRWRDRERVGVTFATTPEQDNAPIPLDLVRRLRRLERENAALRARIVELTEGA